MLVSSQVGCKNVPLFPPSFVCSFLRFFLRSFVRSFVYSFLYSLVHSFLCLFVPSILYFFLCSFVRSLVHSFLYLFICSFLPSIHFPNPLNPYRGSGVAGAYPWYCDFVKVSSWVGCKNLGDTCFLASILPSIHPTILFGVMLLLETILATVWWIQGTPLNSRKYVEKVSSFLGRNKNLCFLLKLKIKPKNLKNEIFKHVFASSTWCDESLSSFFSSTL